MDSGSEFDTFRTNRRNNFEGLPTQKRLIGAVLESWRDLPKDAVSVRSIAVRAKAATSSIGYHFFSLEHLYDAAQTVAIDEANAWIAIQITAIKDCAGPASTPAVRTALFAGLIDEWCENQRALAMARLEAVINARNGKQVALHRSWNEIWKEFWIECARAMGKPEASETLEAFFFGESTQHLLRSSRLLDRALLDETVLAFMLRLDGEPVPRPALRHALEGAAEGMDLTRAAYVPHELNCAAARVLLRSGVSGLTFRAVSQEAARPLGQVAYHFGSKSGLLRHAFEEIYHTAAHSSGEVPPASPLLLQAVCREVAKADQPVLSAFDEITLHISRDPDYADICRAIRARRDPAAVRVVRDLTGGSSATALSLAAAFSSICRGLNQMTLGNISEGSAGDCQRTLVRFLQC